MELAKKLYENVMGTEEQNAKAKKEMAEQDAKNPDTTQAKVNRMVEKVKPTKEPVKKAKGGMIKSSASKRADGCAVKGKTRGRIV
jgi:protein subunit release factor B